MDQITANNLKGRVRAYQVGFTPPTKPHSGQEKLGQYSLAFSGPGQDPKTSPKEFWTPATEFRPNLVLFEWSKITSKLLTTGKSNYRISGMYLEFENVASPGDPVSVPTFERDRTSQYYNDLSGSSVRDYLRVPLTAATTTEEDTQARMDFFARSSGTTGVHGKTFSAAANSTVFGVSLVAFVDTTDATQDLLLSSHYFAVADQQQKLSTSQVGLEWELTLQ